MDHEAPARAGGRGGVALGFAVAALFASWNPIAAPFGLVVGIVAAALAARTLKQGAPRRRVPAAALAMGILAAVASVTVLLLTAGAVGVELPGEPVVKGRTPAQLNQVLADAAERTRAQRERATRELDRLAVPRRDGGSPPGASHRDGGRGVEGQREDSP
ncbi:MAG TPA: hypothetical protein VF904_08965 [Anaeromyxobacteraceae bacterium]